MFEYLITGQVKVVREDISIEVPEADDWPQVYLYRGWELVDVDGRRMLKYLEAMGIPLYPTDTIPFWSDEPLAPIKSRKVVRKRR